jgi:hypothetical protein
MVLPARPGQAAPSRVVGESMHSAKSRPDRRSVSAFHDGFVPRTEEARALDVHDGLVIMATSVLITSRPGTAKVQRQRLPSDIRAIDVVAVEPRSAARYAVATKNLIAVCVPGAHADGLMRIPADPFAPNISHLAWAGPPGQACALFARRASGDVVRLQPDLACMQAIDAPPIAAIAADDNGALALLSLQPRPCVFTSADGKVMQARLVHADLRPLDEIALAVAGDAVAIAGGRDGVYLSRRAGAPFEKVPALACASALAFEGAFSDAALCGVMSDGPATVVRRVDALGHVNELLKLDSRDGRPMQLSTLAWDRKRRRLWGLAPGVGVFSSSVDGAADAGASWS